MKAQIGINLRRGTITWEIRKGGTRLNKGRSDGGVVLIAYFLQKKLSESGRRCDVFSLMFVYA